MMRRLSIRYILLVAVLLFTESIVDVRASGDLGYQPNSNPLDRLRVAQSVAIDEHKRILIIAGGDWCSWCHILDRFLSRNDDVNAALHDAFEVVKVYVGEDIKNEDFFARLPRAVGYPHFWVLSERGEVLESINTTTLENGRDDYRKDAFVAFIESYAVR